MAALFVWMDGKKLFTYLTNDAIFDFFDTIGNTKDINYANTKVK